MRRLLVLATLVVALTGCSDDFALFRQCEADYHNLYDDKGTSADIGMDQYCRNQGGNQ